MKGNEFLRSGPKKRNRNVLFDLTNFIIPLILVTLGVLITTQHFAKLVNYKVEYIGHPIYHLPFRFFGLPKGYAFYNPGQMVLSLSAGITDNLIQSIVLEIVFYFAVFVGAAILSFYLISLIRGYGLSKNDNLYGTARWGLVKDLKKFGLLQRNGVVLAQLNDAVVTAKINPENASISLHLKKPSRLICHSGGTNTLLVAPTRSGKLVGSVGPTLLGGFEKGKLSWLLNIPVLGSFINFCSKGYLGEHYGDGFYGGYYGHMIIFDPKGELYNITAGCRRRHSHVIKFSPVSKDTARFNPLKECSLDEKLSSQIGLISSCIFAKAAGEDGKNDFWDNMAQALFNSAVYHVLTADTEYEGNLDYVDNLRSYNQPGARTIANVIHILALSSAEKTKDADGNETESGGETFLKEMMEVPHKDKDGIHQKYMDDYVKEGASKILGMNPKVRSDVYSTLFAKLTLFSDAYIQNLTSDSDFSIEDFYNSPEPISLYLTVPYGEMKRVMPVFSLLINFMLNRMSAGEIRLGEKEKKLSHRLLFLLDEFPALGKAGGQQIHENLGVLAGYGITFYIICQSLSQLDSIYGKDHTFLSNCKTVMIYAPGELAPAKTFCEMIGKESVTKESISASGSRFSVSFNNLNASSQEVSRDLINADEIMKLPPNRAIIINQGMPPYIATKCVYYEDKRFYPYAFSDRKVTVQKRIGFKAKKPMNFLGAHYQEGEYIFWIPIPFVKEKVRKTTGWPAPYDINEILGECQTLPSNKNRKLLSYVELEKKNIVEQATAKNKLVEKTTIVVDEQDEEFSPTDYIANWDNGSECQSPTKHINDDEEPPPTICMFDPFIFSQYEAG